MSTPLTLIARLTAKPEHTEALGDACVWILYETWRSRTDLDVHFEQPYTKAMLSRFPELLDEEMELTFCTAIR